jgi:hypothetical protein
LSKDVFEPKDVFRQPKDEKKWARAEADPIKIFEDTAAAENIASVEELEARKKKANEIVKASVDFSLKSPMPPRDLAKKLEYPDIPSTDYNLKTVPSEFAEITKKTVDPTALANAESYIKTLQASGAAGTISIGDAVNLAILEEMVRIYFELIIFYVFNYFKKNTF